MAAHAGEHQPLPVMGVLVDDGAFVLVRTGGNHYWQEWSSHTFDGACAELEARERSVGDPPMEVVEVVVRRRATVTSAAEILPSDGETDLDWWENRGGPQ